MLRTKLENNVLKIALWKTNVLIHRNTIKKLDELLKFFLQTK